MRYLCFTFIFCCIFGKVNGQQLNHRESFLATDFVWNPAMTAIWEYGEIGASYRQSWANFQDAPTTTRAFIQYPFLESNMSIGANINLDNIGPIQRTSLNLSYAYKLFPDLFDYLAYDQLQLGIQISFNNTKINAQDAIVNALDDPLLLPSIDSKGSINVGGGFYYATTSQTDNDDPYIYFGAAVNQAIPNQLNLNTQSAIIALQSRLHANGAIGGRFIKGRSMIEPSLWVHYLPTNILLLSFDLRYEWKDVFWTGINYATNQTVGLQFGYIIESNIRERDKKIKVGVQAAYNLGGFGNIQGISYQAIAAYEFGAK